MMNNKALNIAILKQSLFRELSEIYDSNEAFAVTRLVLEHFNFPESSILKNPSAPVEEQTLREIKKIVSDLHKNKPVQYALGEAYFYERLFEINDKVLIPRPETEELVSNILLESHMPAPVILDIGTGSGCIAITLKAMLPGSDVFALDVDPEAIELAKRNAACNNVNIKFLEESIFDFNPDPDKLRFDIIVSNPPYVKYSERNQMHPRVTQYEPELALFVPDDDPLVFYKEIIRLSQTMLNPSGTIWLEINEAHGEELCNVFRVSGYSKIRLLKDIHGKNRFIKISGHGQEI